MYAMDNKSISSLKVLHLVLPNRFICSSSMDNKSISSLKVFAFVWTRHHSIEMKMCRHVILQQL